MKIKNTSSKIISIGTTMMLPDAVIDIADEVYATPGVKALVGKNMISPVIEIATPVHTAPAAPAEPAAEPVAEAPAKKTTTRKAAK